MSRKNCTNIGGQAVLEGVMMRGAGVMATAVRAPDGKIQVESKRFKSIKEKPLIYRIPVIRGIIAFASSMVTGTKTLMRASEVYGDLEDEQPSKFEKWLAKTFKLDIMDIVTAVGVIFGVALSILLFVFVPNWATDGFYKLVSLDYIGSDIAKTIIKNLTSGFIRITIFVLYILFTSFVKDIKRLYRYHGAEHKVISCYEHGLPMTVENAQKMTTVHDRCGTTFMFIVMFFSIIFFSFFGWQELWLRFLIRIACIPLVAGISYELLKFFAKYDNWFVRICKAPGLALQKLTTKQPDDSMVEVALAAFTTVLKMQDDPTIPTTEFITSITVEKAEQQLLTVAGDRKYTDEIELILMNVMGLKTKTELKDNKKRILSTQYNTAESYLKERLTGAPLQYILGEACFYGYDIAVDKRVLIPRFDTELLAEAVIKNAKEYDNLRVLEICCGSGAVAIAIKKNVDCSVTASDISQDALDVAIKNAKDNDVEINFVNSDLFTNIEGAYDIIVANPPYIPTSVLPTLDVEVRDYEPLLALDGGADGLDFYKRIASEYKPYLKDGGKIILEVGIGQAAAVSALFGGESEVINDYNTPPVARVLIIK